MKKDCSSLKTDLPFPPTLNTMYPSKQGGGRTLSKRGRAFKTEVYARLLEQHGRVRLLTGPLKATLEVIPPDHRKRDLDNLIKPVLDGLVAAGVMLDDSQVKVIYAEMLAPSETGACTVIIEEL